MGRQTVRDQGLMLTSWIQLYLKLDLSTVGLNLFMLGMNLSDILLHKEKPPL